MCITFHVFNYACLLVSFDCTRIKTAKQWLLARLGIFGSLPFLYQPQPLTLSPIHASTFARAQPFSTTACQLVKSVQSPRNRREAIASQPSLKVISKKAMKEELPMDFGLLPMFIMPSGDRLPSLVYSTKDRLQLEWKRLKARFNDLRGWATTYI